MLSIYNSKHLVSQLNYKEHEWNDGRMLRRHGWFYVGVDDTCLYPHATANCLAD
jgi:hypothetical protein